MFPGKILAWQAQNLQFEYEDMVREREGGCFRANGGIKYEEGREQ